MMRWFVRLLSWRRSSRNHQKCFSLPSRLAGVVNKALELPVILVFVREGFLFHEFQDFYPLPVNIGRGSSFEGSLLPPPPLSPAGGRHSRAAHSWHSYGAKDWTVEVFHSGYLVPFHRLPPVSQEPLEFPFCASGSTKAHALKGEWTRCWRKEP